jgi:hypothetical protein
MQMNQSQVVRTNVDLAPGSLVLYNKQMYRVHETTYSPVQWNIMFHGPANAVQMQTQTQTLIPTPFNSPMPMQATPTEQPPALDISKDEEDECLDAIEAQNNAELQCEFDAKEAKDAENDFDELIQSIVQFQDTYTYKLRKALYKTVMCEANNTPEGCVYGDKCNFAHSNSELRPKVLSDELQIEHMTRRYCSQYMEKRRYKEKECKNGDDCVYGFLCDFYHESDPVKRCTFGCASECDPGCDMIHLQDELFKRGYMTNNSYTCTCNSKLPCPEGASYA